RDRAPAADDRRLVSSELLDHLTGGQERLVVAGDREGTGAAPGSLDRDVGAGWTMIRHMPLDEPQNLVRVLIRHQTAGDLDVPFTGGDRLGAFTLKAAPDAIDIEGRAREDPFEDRVARLAPGLPGGDAGDHRGLV